MTYGVAAAALATVAAGCGSNSGGSAPTPQSVAPAAGSTSSAHTAGLTVKSTSIGTVVADSRGMTVYELVGDPASNPNCSGECTSIWPPVMAGGQVVVVHGHPVFTFSGDSAPGQTKGEGVTDTWGTWLALNSSGAPIPASGGSPSTAPAQTSSSGSGGSSGGYGY
jgi:predicted lipoprotein with Yx(FWY)xxD motif